MDGIIQDANAEAVRMLGCKSKEEVIGQRSWGYLLGGDRIRSKEYAERMFEKGFGGTIEFKLKDPDGNNIIVESNSTIIRSSGGEPIGLVGVSRDITERKRMEAELRSSEEKLRFMFESIADGIISVDLEGEIVEVNEAIVRMGGYTNRDEMIGLNAFDFVAERDRERALEENLKNVAEGHGSAVQYTAVDKDGNEFIAESVGSMLRDSENSPIGFITVVRDVTERQRMEEALREGEEKLRTIFETSPDFIMSIGRDGTLLFINRTVPEMTLEQAIGTSAYDYIMPEARDDFIKAIEGVFETGELARIETSGLGPDGRTSYYESRLAPVMCDGRVLSVTAVATDITERRQAEEAVRESEERYRALVEGAGTPITTFDTEGSIIVMNETSAKYFGGAAKDFLGKTMHALFPDVADALLERNKRIIETGVVEEHEDLLALPTGNRWFLSSLQPIARPDGDIYAVQVISYDITNRKDMEKTLRDSEEKLRFMFESMGDAIVVVDIAGNITEMNEQLLGMSGYESRDEVLGMNAFDFVAERDRANALETFALNVEQEINATIEYVAVDKYGREFNVEANGAMLRDDNGNPVGFIIALRDVSERKIMEQKLKDSEELARGMLESAATGIYMVQNGKFEYVSPQFAEISGYTENELLGTEALNYVHPDDRDEVREKAIESLKGGSGLPHEFRFVRKDGTNVWVLEKVASIEFKGGRATIASFMDITEYKRAEQAVKESQETLRSFMDSATDYFTIWDSELNLIDLNEAALKYPLAEIPGGIVKERIIGRSLLQLDPDIKESGRYDQYLEVIRTGKPFFAEEAMHHAKHGDMHLAVSAFRVGDGLGIIATDVTERRRAEEELRQGRDELEKRTNQLLALQKVTTSIQSSLELDEMLGQVAEGVVENLGFDQSFILVIDEKADVYRGRASFSKRRKEFTGDVEKIIGMPLTEVTFPRKRGFNVAMDASMDGKVVVTPDFSSLVEPLLDKKQARAIQKLLGAKNIVSTPLFAMERHVGGIIAFTARADVTEADLEPLRLLADQAGVAIVNARAYEVTAEMAQRLAVTSTLSRILGSSLDINEVYQAFTEEIHNVIGFERASIALVEGDQLRLFALSSEAEAGFGQEEMVPLAGSVTEWAIKNKQTNIEPDITIERQFAPDEIYASEGLRSAIRVPLFSKGEAFGSFELVSRTPYAYGEREQGILEQVAGSIATAIENSRLFTRVKEHEAELMKAYEELETAQDYILQVEKLRALGEMAGGVAHDFNNVLAIILGRAQLALEDVKDAKLKRDLQIIEQTAVDAASTVRRLQDFARVRVDRTFGAVDLNKLVEGALEMVESRRVELKETEGVVIDVKAKLGKLPPVSGDTAELREALVNIIFNAMDAMPEGGSVAIRSGQEDDWVVLSVKDTGVGIPEDVKGRIFDPFFTTRAPRGSGLGLSVTYGIITRHGGLIDVESEEGKGSTFHIRLPVATDVKEERLVLRKPVSVESATILLVDDDPEVSEVLELMLRQMGHRVVGANTGEAAVNTFEVGDYDLVITDLGMPDMSGREVAVAVKDIKPGTPVVLITGWGVQLDSEEMPEIDGVVAKPFSKESLLEQIAGLLPEKSGKRKKQQRKKGPK
jgi:PAS domain S-box-containing protein